MIINVRHSDVSSDSTEDGGNLILAKATAMVVLFLTSTTLGVLPIQLNKWFKWSSNTRQNRVVKILLGFGGGVLMCTTFMHLLPEVSENFEELDLTPEVEIHYAELLMCTGFFVMYFIEESVHVYLLRRQKSDDVRALRRSLSLRITEKEAEGAKASKCLDHDHQPHNDHGDHSHVVIDISQNSTVAVIRGLLVVLALSIHELFEGLAVGLEGASGHVWYMFGAVSAHKLVIAFCIGVELVTSGLRTYLTVIYVLTFAVVSPLGIGIGMALTQEGGSSTAVASVFLQGLASGTLLYVVFFEILQQENKHGLKQYFSILTGFIVMFGVTMIELIG